MVNATMFVRILVLMLAILAAFPRDSSAQQRRSVASKPASASRGQEKIVSSGSGIILTEVDPITGKAISARMKKSTGNRALDAEAVRQFSKMRFKPGVAHVETPISYKIREPKSP